MSVSPDVIELLLGVSAVLAVLAGLHWWSERGLRRANLPPAE